jgi:dTDP-glucose 4,6-dehydratase
MKILVTGGCGFIGSNFIHHALKQPDVKHIINVDLMTYAADQDNIPFDTRVETIEDDINNTQHMKHLMCTHDVTHVVHFAAESHVDNSITSPGAFIASNINGTFSMLEAARASGVQRFHHVSTDEVYGSLGATGKFLETTPYDPRSPYSASKASSDHLVRAFHHTYGMNVTISNCSNNYGPRQHREKLIPKTITNILSDKKVPVYGTGENVRDWLFVDDHCAAIWQIITRGTSGSTYNIGGDCEMSNVEMVHVLCMLLGKNFDDVVEFVEDRKGHDFRYAIDHSKITQELGWVPIVTNISEGLQKTIDYYASYR